MFLILAAVVLGSADVKSQSQDLELSDKIAGVAREAENSNRRKKNPKKTRKLKRKRNRTEKKKKGNQGKGKAKKERASKNKAQKKGGKKKKGKRNNKLKKKMKGGKQKKQSRRNKNGKLKRKGNKKGGKKQKERKNNKNKNDRDRRKRRKDSRNKRKNRSASTEFANCYRSTVQKMKIWKDVVKNFQKQNARMIAQNKTGGSKSGKKGLFAPVAFKLIDIGGGNRSNLSCGGTYGSDGAKQLANLTKTLFDCELSVNTSCNTANFPQPNTTFIEACETGTTSFETQV